MLPRYKKLLIILINLVTCFSLQSMQATRNSVTIREYGKTTILQNVPTDKLPTVWTLPDSNVHMWRFNGRLYEGNQIEYSVDTYSIPVTDRANNNQNSAPVNNPQQPIQPAANNTSSIRNSPTVDHHWKGDPDTSARNMQEIKNKLSGNGSDKYTAGSNKALPLRGWFDQESLKKSEEEWKNRPIEEKIKGIKKTLQAKGSKISKNEKRTCEQMSSDQFEDYFYKEHKETIKFEMGSYYPAFSPFEDFVLNAHAYYQFPAFTDFLKKKYGPKYYQHIEKIPLDKHHRKKFGKGFSKLIECERAEYKKTKQDLVQQELVRQQELERQRQAKQQDELEKKKQLEREEELKRQQAAEKEKKESQELTQQEALKKEQQARKSDEPQQELHAPAQDKPSTPQACGDSSCKPANDNVPLKSIDNAVIDSGVNQGNVELPFKTPEQYGVNAKDKKSDSYIGEAIKGVASSVGGVLDAITPIVAKTLEFSGTVAKEAAIETAGQVAAHVVDSWLFPQPAPPLYYHQPADRMRYCNPCDRVYKNPCERAGYMHPCDRYRSMPPIERDVYMLFHDQPPIAAYAAFEGPVATTQTGERCAVDNIKRIIDSVAQLNNNMRADAIHDPVAQGTCAVVDSLNVIAYCYADSNDIESAKITGKIANIILHKGILLSKAAVEDWFHDITHPDEQAQKIASSLYAVSEFLLDEIAQVVAIADSTNMNEKVAFWQQKNQELDIIKAHIAQLKETPWQQVVESGAEFGVRYILDCLTLKALASGLGKTAELVKGFKQLVQAAKMEKAACMAKGTTAAGKIFYEQNAYLAKVAAEHGPSVAKSVAQQLTKNPNLLIQEGNVTPHIVQELGQIAHDLKYTPEKESILSKLKGYLDKGVREENRIETMIDADTKIQFRRDFDVHGLPVGRGYPQGVNIDHYNVEIYHRKIPGVNINRWNKKADFHIVLDKTGNIIDFFNT